MVRALLMFVFGLAVFAGCERIDPKAQKQSIFVPETDEKLVVAVAVDLSGSFYERMAEQGQAYRFLMQLAAKASRDVPGQECRLILAQISGSESPLLWEGYPHQLKHEFSSESEFRKFLESKADQTSSRVIGSLAKTIGYISQHEAIKNRNARSVVLVLSDMLDNSGDGNAQSEAFEKQLTEYRQLGGSMGFYFVNQDVVVPLKALLHRCGFESSIVESEIVSQPALPNFD